MPAESKQRQFESFAAGGREQEHEKLTREKIAEIIKINLFFSENSFRHAMQQLRRLLESSEKEDVLEENRVKFLQVFSLPKDLTFKDLTLLYEVGVEINAKLEAYRLVERYLSLENNIAAPLVKKILGEYPIDPNKQERILQELHEYLFVSTKSKISKDTEQLLNISKMSVERINREIERLNKPALVVLNKELITEQKQLPQEAVKSNFYMVFDGDSVEFGDVKTSASVNFQQSSRLGHRLYSHVYDSDGDYLSRQYFSSRDSLKRPHWKRKFDSDQNKYVNLQKKKGTRPKKTSKYKTEKDKMNLTKEKI